MKIIFSEDAIDDLERLKKFIESKDPEASQRMALELVAGISKLAQFPELGIRLTELDFPGDIRDFIIDDYIARYLLNTNVVTVLRVWHGKEERAGSE